MLVKGQQDIQSNPNITSNNTFDTHKQKDALIHKGPCVRENDCCGRRIQAKIGPEKPKTTQKLGGKEICPLRDSKEAPSTQATHPFHTLPFTQPTPSPSFRRGTIHCV
jgi:hypothetical protein